MEWCINNSPTLFKEVLDSMPNKVWIMDLSGYIVWQNKLSREDMPVGTNFCDPAEVTCAWIHQLSEGSHKDALLESLYDARWDNSGTLEFRRNRTWIRVEYHPLYSTTGVQIGVFGIESDITLKKEALPKLLKMKEDLYA